MSTDLPELMVADTAANNMSLLPRTRKLSGLPTRVGNWLAFSPSRVGALLPAPAARLRFVSRLARSRLPVLGNDSEVLKVDAVMVKVVDVTAADKNVATSLARV